MISEFIVKDTKLGSMRGRYTRLDEAMKRMKSLNRQDAKVLGVSESVRYVVERV